MKGKTAIAIGEAALQFGTTALKVGPLVAAAAVDGKVTPTEAERIVKKLLAENPDLIKVKLNGVDIVDAAAEAELASALVRILTNAVNAEL
jgi:hypothetical protein